MRKCDRITTNPEILGGQPTIRSMRLTVHRVVEAVASPSVQTSTRFSLLLEHFCRRL
jgi:uncharacterized protein (DUF433 family)